MARPRRLAIVFACALPLSQVGRALAALLRGGPGTGSGVEGAALEVSVITLSAGLVAAVTVILLAGGGRSARRAWPFIWIFLALAALQLELHLIQSLAGGATTGEVAVRGLLGQLPVAAAAAASLGWLSARLQPAARRLRRAPSVLLALFEASPAPPLAVTYAGPVGGGRRPAAGPRAPPGVLLTAL